MGESKEEQCPFSRSPNLKITAIEMALKQSLSMFKDLSKEFEQLSLESKNYEFQLLSQKEMCDSKTCKGSIELKKDIGLKDQIIQSVASSLTKLYETKNFETISEIFKCICGEVNVLTPQKDTLHNGNEVKEENVLVSPRKLDSPVYESPFRDESVSEIDDTPTGRKSPIILSKKMRNTSNVLSARDKKKCPGDWSTPEKKNIKLSYPTPTRSKPSGRLRQSRLNLVKLKTSNVVDLISSPECMEKKTDVKLQCNVKKEVLEDETILPSPTSGPVNFQQSYKSILKDSSDKLKMPLATMAGEIGCDGDKDLVRGTGKVGGNPSAEHPRRISSQEKTEKKENIESPSPANESLSLLQHIKKLENKKPCLSLQKQSPPSPSKRPLAENKNIANVEKDLDIDSSISILRSNALVAKKPAEDSTTKRVKPEVREPVYKEPTVRKKADKKALPGWSCAQCKIFYDELYKDNPTVLAQLMAECSRHRGRSDPARPGTPPGFWYPRWDVPDDTEEFNRRNNAV